MSRTRSILSELQRRPFSLGEARAAGLTSSSLQGKAWRRVGTELYARARLAMDPWRLLAAWTRVLPAETMFAGATAAWMFGLDIEPADPVEVIAPPLSGVRSRPGLSARRCDVPAAEVTSINGLRATTLPRSLIDLCLRRPAVEALVAIDMALYKGLATAAELQMERGRHRPGAGRLRTLAALAAPAESPMETRLRWLLIQAGLPRPEVQTELFDGALRADLYYPSARLVVEYDGGNHRERLVEDDQRQNRLITAGFHVLRFTATDVYRRPEAVVSDVRAALG